MRNNIPSSRKSLAAENAESAEKEKSKAEAWNWVPNEVADLLQLILGGSILKECAEARQGMLNATKL